MSEPLRPGQKVGDWSVQQLLSWGPRGGLYRVNTPGGPAILKEIIYPSGVDARERTIRSRNLQRAVEHWQDLSHPQAISVLQVQHAFERVYLLLPELEGSTLQVQAKLRKEPPDPRQAVLWADQIASLVQAMQELKHPLALEILRSDRILLNSQGHLTVFNPGWSELLWRDSNCFFEAPVQDGLRLYGQLLVEMTTGDSQHGPDLHNLPAGLLWIGQRCLSNMPDRCYHDFTEVRQGLKNLVIHGDEARNMRVLGSLPPIFGFTLPRLADIPRSPRRFQALLVCLCVLLSGLLGLAWSVVQTRPPSRPGLALAIGRYLYTFNAQHELRRARRFGRPIQAMVARRDGARLYVALENDPELQVLDLDRRENHSLSLASPPELLIASDPSEIMAILKQGRVLRLNVRKDWETPLDSLQAGRGCTGIALVPLAQPGNPSHIHPHREGIVAINPQLGLALYDASTGQRLAEWPHSGYRSAMVTAKGQLLTASDQGELQIFSAQLRPQGQRLLPLDSGQAVLYPQPYSNFFWSLQSNSPGKSSVAGWNAQELKIEWKLLLDSPPKVATVDDQGYLWWIDSRQQLHRLTHHPFREDVLVKLPGTVQAMTYLAPDRTPQGLQRLMDQPLPRPKITP